MKLPLLSFILTIFSAIALGQTIKTDVVVIGGNAGAVAAAVQAARSGVKATLLEVGTRIGSDITAADTVGSWAILKELTKKKIAPGSQLKALTDTVKNLSVINNSSINEIEESGQGWKIKLKDGRKIKCLVIADGGDHTSLIEDKPADIVNRLLTPSDVYASKQYRAAAASGKNVNDLFTLGSLVSKAENYVFTSPIDNAKGQMYTGQAAGAIAAYAAFFKTSTRNINVRMTQGELLRYSGRLIPVQDITPADSNFLAIQHIAATGILKLSDGKFNPGGTVSANELRLPLKEYYSRSQIWFADHNASEMTINDAISLIMFSGARGNELKREIEQGWKSSFKFTTDFDASRKITRRELAVLFDNFLQPFNLRVDFQGNLLN